jgi:branched-chain amino acid transport system ATP-binding protein
LPRYKKAEQHALEKARYWLNKIDLIDKADWEAGNLPYGDQRRLEIARAMCMKPVLLCLDEPAAGLNPKESADLNTLLQDICNTEKTSLLLIEHDMSVVMNISHHIIVLEYGRRIAAGTPQEIKNNPDVIRAYLGEEAA